jgi:DNA-directed RNA polymerase sigma subunit (sigma70/sigma32)
MLSADQITDRLADEVVARVDQDHPEADATRRRQLVRIYLRRLDPEFVGHTLAEVGHLLGQSPQRVHELERRALARAYSTYRARYSHLL